MMNIQNQSMNLEFLLNLIIRSVILVQTMKKIMFNTECKLNKTSSDQSGINLKKSNIRLPCVNLIKTLSNTT